MITTLFRPPCFPSLAVAFTRLLIWFSLFFLRGAAIFRTHTKCLSLYNVRMKSTRSPFSEAFPLSLGTLTNPKQCCHGCHGVKRAPDWVYGACRANLPPAYFDLDSHHETRFLTPLINHLLSLSLITRKAELPTTTGTQMEILLEAICALRQDMPLAYYRTFTSRFIGTSFFSPPELNLEAPIPTGAADIRLTYFIPFGDVAIEDATEWSKSGPSANG